MPRPSSPTASVLLLMTAIASLLSLPGGAGAAPRFPPDTQALHALFDAYWEFAMREYPTWATYLGDHRYGDRLTDLSVRAHEARYDSLERYVAAVRAFVDADLPARERTSAELFEHDLENTIEGRRFRPYLIPMNQQNGPHIDFPQLIDVQPFESAADYKRFIARLRAFPAQIDQIITCMQLGIQEGIVAYRGNIGGCLPQIETHIVTDPTTSVFYSPFATIGESIPDSLRLELQAEAQSAIAEAVVPAYRRLADFVEQQYIPLCRSEPGIRALPDGGERYAFAVRHHTTLDLTPEEIHATGRREMERIRQEMDGIRRTLEFKGDLEAFLGYLRTDPAFYYDDPAELMAGFSDILERIDAELPRLFGRLPKSRCDLKEMEAYRAAAAPAAYYYAPPDDGSRPGYFYVNTHDLPARPKYTMEALAYHEAVPGHHLQIALQQELGELPDFRRHLGFSAFVEGWALYAERLPKEIGFYADPYSEFGRLTFEAWRASRLVVDTGIHALGWSRDRAIAYLKQNTALSEHDITSEVDRYIAWPGQALAYKIGELEIRDLRRRAEEALGNDFDVRAFHDKVLAGGAIPLEMLERFVEDWINAQRRQPTGD